LFNRSFSSFFKFQKGKSKTELIFEPTFYFDNKKIVIFVGVSFFGFA